MTEAAEALDSQVSPEPPEQQDPRDIARAVAMDVADAPEQVGEVVDAIELDDNVTDFRLTAHVRGYEGWQWSVTLYHDVEVGTWTVNESSLVPTDSALMPPAWVPWKDRLEPTDLAPTDSIGTDPDDSRLEGGFRKTEPVAGTPAGEVEKPGEKSEESVESAGTVDEKAGTVESTDEQTTGSTEAAKSEESAESQGTAGTPESVESSGTAESTASTEAQGPAESRESQEFQGNEEAAKAAAQPRDAQAAAQAREAQETEEIVEELQLSRRHVLSPQGRAQVAKRWYEGPRGPKAMSTKTADGNLCSTCGFFVPLQGDLNRMFGVCANKWSPDDGRVVSIDHGCGEHSEIEPPEPSHLWVQSKPAYDDFHIDVIAQKPRDERGAVEAIEQSEVESQDSDEATEEDILANTEPDTGDDEPNEEQPSGVDASAELETVIDIAEGADALDRSGESESGESESAELGSAKSEPAESELAESESVEGADPDDSADTEAAGADESSESAKTAGIAESDAIVESSEVAETVESVVEVVTAGSQVVVESEEASVESVPETPAAVGELDETDETDETREASDSEESADDMHDVSESAVGGDIAAVSVGSADSFEPVEVPEQAAESAESAESGDSADFSAEQATASADAAEPAGAVESAVDGSNDAAESAGRSAEPAGTAD